MSAWEFNFTFMGGLLFGIVLQWCLSNIIRMYRENRCRDCHKFLCNDLRLTYQTGSGKLINPLCSDCFHRRMGF